MSLKGLRQVHYSSMAVEVYNHCSKCRDTGKATDYVRGGTYHCDCVLGKHMWKTRGSKEKKK